MKTLKDYSDDELENLIRQWHCEEKIALREIARRLDTYAVKLLRFCNKRNIPVLTKSESLKAAYEADRITPSMLGKTLSDEAKRKLGEAHHNMWESMSEDERKRRADISRQYYEQKTESEKSDFAKKGARAIYQASLTGSKSEHALKKLFEQHNIEYIHHYKELLPGTKLEVDFYLPTYNTVVEIDGPSHFKTNLGLDNLKSQQDADNKKNGLVLSLGASIVRFTHQRTLYKRDHLKIFETLKTILPSLENELRIFDVDRL